MNKTLTILALLLVLPIGSALADEDCFAPMAEWQPRDAVQRLAKASGWTVRRIKIDDGCYEIDGLDAEGRRIEVKIHPATLQVLEIEYQTGNDVHPRRNRNGDEEAGGGD